MPNNKQFIPKGYRRIRLGETLPEDYIVYKQIKMPYYKYIEINGRYYIKGKESGEKNNSKDIIRLVKIKD